MSTVLGPVFADLCVGDVRQTREAPITRVVINRYAGASGDYNPSHVHERVPAGAGMDGIFAHGMIGTGYLGKVVTDWVVDHPITRLTIRATKVVRPGTVLTCTATVSRKWVHESCGHAEFAVEARDQEGDLTHVGTAIVRFAEEPTGAGATASTPDRGSSEYQMWRVIG